MPDITLDFRQRHRILLARETDGVALGAGAGGAADAVHVVGRVLRQVEVEHVADVRDVQAARGHIGGDQDGELAVVEIAQEAQALVLRHVPGERSEEHTSELQSHSDLVCRLLLEKKKQTDFALSHYLKVGSTAALETERVEEISYHVV